MNLCKKSYLATAVATALALSTTAVNADTESHSSAHVYVNVVSNISVQALTSNVGMDDVQTGDITGELKFRVEANMEAVTISAGATKLYKGDDPSNIEVEPILLDTEKGATYIADNANPLAGASNNASCSESAEQVLTPNGPMDSYDCDSIKFESSQDGYFSQDVMVELHWNQDDPEKTTGEYSGYVFFWASLLDDDSTGTDTGGEGGGGGGTEPPAG